MLLSCDTLGGKIGGYLCFGGKHCLHLQDEVVRQVYRIAVRHCSITPRWFKNWRPQDLLLVDGGRELCRNIDCRMRHGSNGVCEGTLGKSLLDPYCLIFIRIHYSVCGPRYLRRYCNSLGAAWFGDRIPVGARFSAPVRTGPVAQPASYTMGTGSLSPA